MKKIFKAIWKILKWLGIVIIVFSISFFLYLKITSTTLNQAGLSILGCLKELKGDAVDFSSFDQNETKLVNHDLWDNILKDHIHEGLVDYSSISKDERFIQYLEVLSNNPPGNNWKREEKLAYWINAYNAFTVKLIIENYPVSSIKDIADGTVLLDSAWDIKFFKIGGIDFDLNTVEHDILREDFDEPRIHFVINCASISCPNLLNEAYTSAELEAQLDRQTRAFLNDDSKNIISAKGIQLSSIFSWFEGDFKKFGGVIEFIKIYKPEINENLPIEYLEYDWNLNEIKL